MLSPSSRPARLPAFTLQTGWGPLHYREFAIWIGDRADTVGISASNAGVRIFRTREALRQQIARSCGTCAEHGYLDCTCGAPRGSG